MDLDFRVNVQLNFLTSKRVKIPGAAISQIVPHVSLRIKMPGNAQVQDLTDQVMAFGYRKYVTLQTGLLLEEFDLFVLFMQVVL